MSDKPIRICSNCRDKPVISSTGSWCRSCIARSLREYRKTPAGLATTAWNNIRKRCDGGSDKKRSHKNRSYRNTNLLMTRDQFMAWAVPAYTTWLSDNPGKQPSVDRIESSGHYVLGNLRIVEMVENSRKKPSNKNHYAPVGQAWCSGHRSYVDIKEFSPAPSRPPLFVNNRCRECKRVEYRRKVDA